MTEKTMMQHYADMHKTNVEMGESSREPACYDALKQQIETLHDQLHNGIKYDEKLNAYVVCWTEKQIEDAKREADELLSKMKQPPPEA